MNALSDTDTEMTDEFGAARETLRERFEHCAIHLNHTAPRSSYVDTSDPDALTLRVGRHGYFTFRRSPDGPVYAWWYPASRMAVGDHHIAGDPVPVVRTALIEFMHRAKSELG